MEKVPAVGNAIDLSHHLSELAKRRKTSPLKGLQKYISRPGTIMLAGGLPDPSYFPFASIGGQGMVPDSFALVPEAKGASAGPLQWLWDMFGASKERTETLEIPRFAAKAGDIDLATSLQYGPAVGLQKLQDFIRNFASQVYRPAYADWTTLVHVGNTDGWSRCVLTLCNPGEGMLTEEWTYPSAVALAAPYQVTAVPVGMDADGMSSAALEKLLSEWDPVARGGMKRPHVMYTVPVGQNPCGTTMGLQRKKEIYEICVKYDVIIVEDDPYYFLQEGVYQPKDVRAKTKAQGAKDTKHFLASLTPSYLRIDYQGRVVRLDTFSKTIAPGSRLGFFTCNPVFAERFERQGETTTQRPCGFGQALIGQLLANQWGFDAYVRWLAGLQAQYTLRRDTLCDALLGSFSFRQSYSDGAHFARGLPVYTGYARPRKGEKFRADKALVSFVPPTSGMFVWLKVHFENLPESKQVRRVDDDDDEPELPTDPETRLWVNLAEAGLLIGPGTFFAAEPAVEAADPGHYRIAFSSGPLEKLKEAMDIFGRVVHEFFDEA